MAYDPYSTYAAGSITANLIAAQTALEAAATASLRLDLALYREVMAARDAVKAVRKRDLWEASR